MYLEIVGAGRGEVWEIINIGNVLVTWTGKTLVLKVFSMFEILDEKITSTPLAIGKCWIISPLKFCRSSPRICSNIVGQNGIKFPIFTPRVARWSGKEGSVIHLTWHNIPNFVILSKQLINESMIRTVVM